MMSERPPVVVSVTIGIERSLAASPDLVFGAYADVDQRAMWSAPPSEVIVFESNEFRVGGVDHFVRSERDRPTVAGTRRYEHIVDGHYVVLTERLTNPDDQLLAVSLVTWSIIPSGPGARLSITDQTVSVAGSRPIEGARYRYETMLDRLADHLARSGR